MTDSDKVTVRRFTGKCFCGSIRYAVGGDFEYAFYCHCSNCRRATASAFKPLAGIKRDKVVVTEGSANLMIVGEENRNDTHCRLCGSLLYSVVRDGAYIHIAMGTLVDDPLIRPTMHIFVGSKAPWISCLRSPTAQSTTGMPWALA
jgi:hypothetical protein